MARRYFERSMIPPILLLNFALYIIVLGIAGWALDSMMNQYNVYGNSATPNFTIFTLIAGAVGIASVLAGLHLVKDPRTESIAASSSSALIAWALLLISFGLACKEIDVGNTGTTLKFMEAFVIILTATQGFYLLLLHADLLAL